MLLGNAVRGYFRQLYRKAMADAYQAATDEIVAALEGGGRVLDCGASRGRMFATLEKHARLERADYFGIEWQAEAAAEARRQGLQVVRGDLNHGMPYADDTFGCVFAL